MLSFALAAALTAASSGTWIDNRPVDKKSLQHVGTGFVSGTAAMGLCTTYLVLRERSHGDEPKISTWACFGIAVGAATLAYHYKELVYDPQTYGSRKAFEVDAKGRRDMLEGIVPAALGAALFIPVASW